MHIEGGEDGDLVWFTTDECSGAWVPLRRCDQGRIRFAELRGEHSVNVNAGRDKIKLPQRVLVCRYGRSPKLDPRPVKRARWFRGPGNCKEPYEEDEDDAIEQAYKRMRDLARYTAKSGSLASVEFTETVDLPNSDEKAHPVQIVLLLKRDDRASWKLQTHERTCSSWSLFETRKDVSRGYGEIPLQDGEIEESLLGDEVGRLMVLVHGIGEKLWSQEGNGMVAQSVGFRRMVHQAQLESAGYVKALDGSWEYRPDGELRPNCEAPKLPRDEIVTASWWQSVHTDELDEKLSWITLPTLSAMRTIANCALSDVFLYLQNTHRTTISAAVIVAVNLAVSQFRKSHPTFTGEIVLLGHSLGGLILFEILRNHIDALSFTPICLFSLGSPTGAMIHCADEVPDSRFKLPHGVRFFNIFHPLDPVAYRIEPLLEGELRKVPPAQIASTGGVKVHHEINNFWRWAQGADKRDSQFMKGIKLKLNANDRVDWCLQDDLNIIGTAGELLQALPSHGCYFKSQDVATFIHLNFVRMAEIAAKERKDKEEKREQKKTTKEILERPEEQDGEAASKGKKEKNSKKSKNGYPNGKVMKDDEMIEICRYCGQQVNAESKEAVSQQATSQNGKQMKGDMLQSCRYCGQQTPDARFCGGSEEEQSAKGNITAQAAVSSNTQG